MKIILPLLFTLITINAFAQKNYNNEDVYTKKALSFGPEIFVPGKTDFKIGAGASGQAEYPISDLVSVIGTLSYTRYYYKINYNEFGTVGPSVVIPVKAGAKFFLDPDFHCDIDAGIAFETNYDKRKSFAIGFVIGYILPLKNFPGGLDVGLKFEDWGKERLRAIGLRAAYRLAW